MLHTLLSTVGLHSIWTCLCICLPLNKYSKAAPFFFLFRFGSCAFHTKLNLAQACIKYNNINLFIVRGRVQRRTRYSDLILKVKAAIPQSRNILLQVNIRQLSFEMQDFFLYKRTTVIGFPKQRTVEATVGFSMGCRLQLLEVCSVISMLTLFVSLQSMTEEVDRSSALQKENSKCT